MPEQGPISTRFSESSWEHSGGQEPESQSLRHDFFPDPQAWLASLKAECEGLPAEVVEKRLRQLGKMVSSPERKVSCYVDPQAQTFYCGEVPAKRITQDGKIIPDTDQRSHQYIIGIPAWYVAPSTPDKFLRGEIDHEMAHALFTDFSRMPKLRQLAESEGYNARHLLDLDNCVEDPRIERVLGSPSRPGTRQDLFAKNKLLILASLSKDLDKAPPMAQFPALLKLEGLWRINADLLQGVAKPWKMESLDPAVQAAFEQVKETLFQITGSVETPALKKSPDYYRLLTEVLWPALKSLIPTGQEQSSGSGNGEGDGQGSGDPGTPDDSTQPGNSQPASGNNSPEGQMLDPQNPENWPEPAKSAFQKLMQAHQKRLEEDAKQQGEEFEKSQNIGKDLKQERERLLTLKDGIRDPKARKVYDQLSAASLPVTKNLERLFQQLFPKNEDEEEVWGRRGNKLSVPELLKRMGTGQERPMLRKDQPTTATFIITVIIDVSGSMYQDMNRINNALSASISLLESSVNSNVQIEILASDDQNVSHDTPESAVRYCIKAFDEEFGGPVKERLVSVLKNFGGNNEDADSLKVAAERLERRRHEQEQSFDKIGGLLLFITDSTTSSDALVQQVAQTRARGIPVEGVAITSDPEIKATLRQQYGPESEVPDSPADLPASMRKILMKHARPFL